MFARFHNYGNSSTPFVLSPLLTIDVGTCLISTPLFNHRTNDFLQYAGSVIINRGSELSFPEGSSYRLLGRTLGGSGSIGGSIIQTGGIIQPGGGNIGALVCRKLSLSSNARYDATYALGKKKLIVCFFLSFFLL